MSVRSAHVLCAGCAEDRVTSHSIQSLVFDSDFSRPIGVDGDSANKIGPRIEPPGARLLDVPLTDHVSVWQITPWLLL